MKQYTQEEFDAIERDGFGVKRCPTGDYTQVKSFGERCSFGADCSFGEACRFRNGCRCEFGEFNRLLTCGGFGSKGRTTYFWLMADGTIMVRCGCFTGSLEQWEERVKDRYQDDLRTAYLSQAVSVKAQARYLQTNQKGGPYA